MWTLAEKIMAEIFAKKKKKRHKTTNPRILTNSKQNNPEASQTHIAKHIDTNF